MEDIMYLGKIIKDIAPTEGNPRNSEGDFISLEDGRIMFIYSRFYGTEGRDDSPSDLACIYSYDGGESFGEEKIIIRSVDEEALNIMSVTLRHLDNGDIGLFYIRRINDGELALKLRRSSDMGESWSEATHCLPAKGYYVLNNDRVNITSKGRWIIPTAFHRNGLTKVKGTRFDTRGTVVFFSSDDDCKTFREMNGKCSMPFNRHFNSGLQEPGFIELNNGVLWAWARTDLGCQYEMFSFDDGESWTSPEPSRFSSPCSPLSIKRNPFDDSLVAVWNPIPEYNGRKNVGYFTGGRTPFVLAVSRDDSKTWSEPVILDDDEMSGYCYCAMYFTKDALLLGYCAGGEEDKLCLARTRIRKIPLCALDNI